MRDAGQQEVGGRARCTINLGRTVQDYVESARGGVDPQGGPRKKKLKISLLESHEKNVDLMITNSADSKFGFYMTDLITYSCKEKTGLPSQSQISLQAR
jgi:hypothetical protein